MNICDAGLALIKSFEQCRFEAYLPTPKDVPTIAYGHTRGVKMGDTCTQEEADQWLREDLSDAEGCVSMALDNEPTPEQFSAMVSLCFNIGCGAFKGSTLVKLMNSGSTLSAASQFTRWDKQNGTALAGLTRRRQAEMKLFLT